MKNRIALFFCLVILSGVLFAQPLSVLSVTMQPAGKSYLSIINKKVYTEDEALDVKSAIDFDESAEQKLLDYHFPGNIRELQYVIERAVIMSDGEVLRANDLTFSPIESATEPTDEITELKLSTVEKSTILRVIEKHHGNISRAAKELGLTRTALYRRLSKYNI